MFLTISFNYICYYDYFWFVLFVSLHFYCNFLFIHLFSSVFWIWDFTLILLMYLFFYFCHPGFCPEFILMSSYGFFFYPVLAFIVVFFVTVVGYLNIFFCLPVLLLSVVFMEGFRCFILITFILFRFIFTVFFLSHFYADYSGLILIFVSFIRILKFFCLF